VSRARVAYRLSQLNLPNFQLITQPASLPSLDFFACSNRTSILATPFALFFAILLFTSLDQYFKWIFLSLLLFPLSLAPLKVKISLIFASEIA
jgi:hypothetical protein